MSGLYEPIAVALCFALLVFSFKVGLRLAVDPQMFRKSFALRGEQGDAMTHMLLVHLIRENGGRIPKMCPKFLLGPELEYPVLFHKLLALLPKHSLERFEWAVSPAIEALHTLVVFAFAYYVAHQHLGGGSPLNFAAMVTGGFVITPLLNVANHRGSILSARPFGFLTGNIYLVAVGLLILSHNPVYALIAVVAGVVTFVSSKFGTQAIVLISILWAGFSFDPIPVSVLAAAFVAAVPLSGGYVLRVFKGNLRFFRFYRSVTVKISDYTSSFANSNVAASIGNLARGKVVEAWRAWRKHPSSRVLFLAPWLIPFFLMIAREPYVLTEEGLLKTLTTWAMASVVVMLVVYWDGLKFIGEAERYLDFGLFPLILACVVWSGEQAPLLILLMTAWSFGYCIVRRHEFFPGITANPETLELLDYLKTLDPKTIVSIPARLAFPIAYETEHLNLFVLVGAPANEDHQRDMKTLFEGAALPFVTPAGVAKVAPSFGVDTLIFDKITGDYVTAKWGVEYDFSGHPTIFENGRYMVKKLFFPKLVLP
ncbi:MAG: hypothetical protein HQ494_02280 [Rhodospirillales bacterium]|nr:hypothetical protein [Rhodospirillales bacterium]